MTIIADTEIDLARQYFDDIAESKPLSRERERELSDRIKAGDRQARDDLVLANVRFVINVAKTYVHRGLSLPELIGAGNVGLITAAERFDGTRGLKFISYAVWWIRQSILKAISEQSRTVRLPLSQLSLISDVSKASHRLDQNSVRDFDLDDIADDLGVPAGEIWEIVQKGRPAHSLDESHDENDDRTFLEKLTDESQPPPDRGVDSAQLRRLIDAILERLNEREHFIVVRYYGLSGKEAMTLGKIGESLNLTRERVRQIKEQALAKLRKPAEESHPNKEAAPCLNSSF